MSDKFRFLSQFYANFRKMNDLSVSIKMKKINFGNFVLPKKKLPPPPPKF